VAQGYQHVDIIDNPTQNPNNMDFPQNRVTLA